MFLMLDEQHASSALKDAADRLEGERGEVVLDLSAVRRIDSAALLALDQFAEVAHKKGVKVVLRGASVPLYRTLKLVKLARRFSFAEHCEVS